MLDFRKLTWVDFKIRILTEYKYKQMNVKKNTKQIPTKQRNEMMHILTGKSYHIIIWAFLSSMYFSISPYLHDLYSTDFKNAFVHIFFYTNKTYCKFWFLFPFRFHYLDKNNFCGFYIVMIKHYWSYFCLHIEKREA